MHAVSHTRSDADLIAAAQAGDRAAFGALVSRYQKPAIRIAAVALGSPTGADDVAQEAFVKAHAALPRFTAGSPFQPWLYRIVTNTAHNTRRHSGRQRALAFRAADLAPAGGLAPEDVAVHSVDRQVLVEAINRLGPDDRLVLTYRWYLDMTESEIAVAMDCRPGTVKSRLSRAMSRLRAQMEEK